MPVAGARNSGPVLVSGCSSGIGRATARRLARAGRTVYATARQLEDIKDLEDEGCRILSLDVTEDDSMRAAVQAVERAEGAVGVLVNNAGYSQSGAVETIRLDLIRRQFETNVFGLVRLTQLVLPGMRQRGWGRIVNLSSMGGRLTFPGGGVYHATKHAVEALSDALRFEVRGFGIDVVVIEPGLIRTGFGDAAVHSLDEVMGESPYAAFNAAVADATKSIYGRGLLARFGGEPEAVADVIERAIAARHPRSRYPVTLSARLVIALRAVLPDRAWDRFLRTQFPEPVPEKSDLDRGDDR